MRLRFRFFGALVALLALTAYFADAVWASMCSPEMQRRGAEEVVAQGPVEQNAPEHPCPTGANDAAPEAAEQSEQPEQPEQSRSDGPACPLGPIGASGSCVAASLPARMISMALSFPKLSLVSLASDSAGDLLLVAALFHPPKA